MDREFMRKIAFIFSYFLIVIILGSDVEGKINVSNFKESISY